MRRFTFTEQLIIGVVTLTLIHMTAQVARFVALGVNL